MCISRRSGGSGLFSPIRESRTEFREFAMQLVDRGPHVETQVGGNLLVAAAAAVQLVSDLADARHQLLLDKMMHILSFIVFSQALLGSGSLLNLLQPFENADELIRGKNAGALEGTSVGSARRQFVAQQAAIELKRSLPALELRVERVAETSRPHLHRATSMRARARVRDGSPRMRINPAASF